MLLLACSAQCRGKPCIQVALNECHITAAEKASPLAAGALLRQSGGACCGVQTLCTFTFTWAAVLCMQYCGACCFSSRVKGCPMTGVSGSWQRGDTCQRLMAAALRLHQRLSCGCLAKHQLVRPAAACYVPQQQQCYFSHCSVPCGCRVCLSVCLQGLINNIRTRNTPAMPANQVGRA